MSNLPPGSEEDWLQEVEIDANSGLLANAYCRANVITQVAVRLDAVTDPDGQAWLQQWALERGIPPAPQRECTSAEQPPEVQITAPAPGQEVYQYVEIVGTVDLADFDRYELFYGIGTDPQGWGWISGPHLAMVRDSILGVWQIPQDFTPGGVTLRVVAYNQQGARFEARQPVMVIGPTPTPTPEATATATPTPTATVTPTPEPVTPTMTPALPTETPTPAPTDMPVETASPTAIPATPTPTATPEAP